MKYSKQHKNYHLQVILPTWSQDNGNWHKLLFALPKKVVLVQPDKEVGQARRQFHQPA